MRRRPGTCEYHAHDSSDSDEPHESYQPCAADEPYDLNDSHDPNQSFDPNDSLDPNDSHDPNQSYHPNQSYDPDESCEPNESHQSGGSGHCTVTKSSFHPKLRPAGELQQAQFSRPPNRRAAVLDAELAVHGALVGLHGVERDI
ncbi:hypothetical protein MMAN_56640 [Mycobacterium mantenii]|uniref:Uncharacterized protein n=1 Tax=Mycobacterium mantenii TaxID=560555 RepID=A0ABN6AJE7_MYCNT|nr:hypothetical protein [Mycobacterium mantenii]MCV7243692.1 hypothetical protein [Mycobacterium mantenii]BBY41530.1 hypothetical protein MMAN_56640 [Mycobacterium mantenii]